jgi:hypothetical protein
MKIENWLTIAVIISQLIAPWLNGLFSRSRTAQPTPTPELNQPKNRTQRISGWFLNFLQSPWTVPPFLILLNIYLLISEFRRTTPITHWTVYQISAAVAGIWYGIVAFFLQTAWQSIRNQWEINREQRDSNREIIALIRDLNRTQSEIDRNILDLVVSVSNGLSETTTKSLALAQSTLTELEESKRGKLSKLWTTIKHRFGR